MTSYPQREAVYPLITIKLINRDATRAGMQVTAMDITAEIEIRVWARNHKEKDELGNDIFDRLRSIQFTASTGSVANNLHDFTLLSDIEVVEEGEKGIKSRVLTVQYKFYNVT